MAYGKKKMIALSRIIASAQGHAGNDHGEPCKTASSYAKRNNKLIARYYYYTVLKKKKAEEVLEALADDFDISTIRISQVLDQHTKDILELRKQSPSLTWFRKQWPKYQW
jgi:hypothetical protein